MVRFSFVRDCGSIPHGDSTVSTFLTSRYISFLVSIFKKLVILFSSYDIVFRYIKVNFFKQRFFLVVGLKYLIMVVSNVLKSGVSGSVFIISYSLKQTFSASIKALQNL